MFVGPVMETTGFPKTCNVDVGLDVQPVEFSVKVKVTCPAETPVTNPEPLTVATAGLDEVQTPPVEGVTVVVDPIQIDVLLIFTVGLPYTVTLFVAFDTHPVDVLVNIKPDDPGAKPVTNPALVTDATDEFTKVHVPPVEGDKVVVPPIQIPFGPVTETTGLAFTVSGAVGRLEHPVVLLVNVKVTFPCPKPVTKPAFVTLATDGLLLIHIPPEFGDNVVEEPTHIGLFPVI